MKLLTDLLSHLLLFGFITAACFFCFVFLIGGIGFIFKILWAVFYLLTDLLSHLLLFGFITAACFFCFVFLIGGIGFIFKILWAVFYPVYLITLKPFIWGMTALFQSRCPECGGFLKKKLLDFEIADEREVLRTIDRIDQGVLYSNHLFAANQGFEISRQEQVRFVEQTILNHWECKDSTCGHKWKTEEFKEWEGSKD